MVRGPMKIFLPCARAARTSLSQTKSTITTGGAGGLHFGGSRGRRGRGRGGRLSAAAAGGRGRPGRFLFEIPLDRAGHDVGSGRPGGRSGRWRAAGVGSALGEIAFDSGGDGLDDGVRGLAAQVARSRPGGGGIGFAADRWKGFRVQIVSHVNASTNSDPRRSQPIAARATRGRAIKRGTVCRSSFDQGGFSRLLRAD